MDDLMTTDACTLPTTDRPTRLAEFDDLFAASARQVTRDDRGVRILLSGPNGLREQVLDLTRRETECCSFFTFGIEGDGQDLTLDISVPPGRREILDALAERALERCA